MTKITENAVHGLVDKITTLLTRHREAIDKSFRNSDSNKYAFGIGVSIKEAVRDDEYVLVLKPTISFSEKHSDYEEVIIGNDDQLRMDTDEAQAG